MQIHRAIFKEKRKIALRRACTSKTTALNNTMATKHESRVLSTPNSTMIATGIISNIIYITEVQNKPHVAFTQLN